MPDPVLEQMLASARQTHDAQYKQREPDSDLIPMYYLYRGTQVHAVVVLAELPEDYEVKAAVVQQMRKLAEQKQCDGYAFSVEGYTVPLAAARLRVPGERLADRPDRIEVLTVQVGTKQGGKAAQAAYITRDGVNPPALQWQPPAYHGEQGSSVESRFALWGTDDPRHPQPEMQGSVH